MSDVASIPAATWTYTERTDVREGAVDRAVAVLVGRTLARLTWWNGMRLSTIVPQVNRHEPVFAAMDDGELRHAAVEMRRVLRREGLRRAVVARSFALIREASKRVLGMRHFDVQLLGGWALIRGMVAEMETGEGKTLTASLAAATSALAGTPVHVITVNDYLAGRDADLMRPLYEFLGLSVGVVVQGQPPDQRKAAYACDVTFCTNKEAAFDYLRDRLVLGERGTGLQLGLDRIFGDSGRLRQLVLRGLPFAIVDEADSILVDEARTPLILSGRAESQVDADTIRRAMQLAPEFTQGREYLVLTDERRVVLTDAGKERLREETRDSGGLWRAAITREELLRLALTATHLFHAGEHYLVRDGKLQIIDEYTGRVMPDRLWGEGLHQMMEAKEGLELSEPRSTLARITYQRFFRRYGRLAGMTGTAAEIADELWSVYRLAVARIPTNRPSARRVLPDRVLPTDNAKWQAIAERVGELHRSGVPVLLGTRSVAASERASKHLRDAGIPHAVLNAAQDAEEAALVARAGEPGRVTVATNMAGRGTDIRLAKGVAEKGGLHVVMSERHDSRRIDRQLAGRCGRQGEPGCFEAILSLEDDLLDFDRRSPLLFLARSGWPALGRAALGRAQRRAQRLHSRIRRELLRADRNLDDALAFSGRPE